MKFLQTHFDLFNLYTNGIPIGEFTVITGLEATGKTTFLFQLLKNVPPDNKIIYYNTEKQLLDDRIKILANRDDIIIKNDYITIETLWEDIEKEIYKNETSKKTIPLWLLWDSIAQTSFIAEEKGKIGDSEMALRARLLSSIFRKYLGNFKKLNITFIATNQLRFKIGASPFEEPYVMPGGKAPYYASFLYIYLKRKGFYKFAENKNAVIVNFQIKKNNALWAPVEFPMILTPKGFDNDLSIFNYLLENDIIKYSSAGWYVYAENNIKFKRNDLSEFIKKHKKDILNKIQVKINELYR